MAIPIVTAASNNGSWFTGFSAGALVAGKHTLVGDITLTQTDDTVNVQVEITAAGWELVETHIHVADALEGIPQKNGNPIPGQFMDNVDHAAGTTIYDQDFDIEGMTTVFIAVHAVVRGTDNCEPVEETAWGGGGCGVGATGYFPGRNWAIYIVYTPT